MAAVMPAATQARAKTIHPLWLRLTHWLNVIAVFIMVLSGWRIYNASPIFDFKFAGALTIGGWLGGALLWHFAAMWLLAVNGLIYLLINAGTGRIKQRFWPVRPRELIADLLAALRGQLTHADLAHYNAVQKAAYLFVIADLIVLVLSGLVIWKPVQLAWLTALMGGFDSARVVHFVAMAALVGFVIVHVAMVAIVPRTLRLMILGR